MTDVPEIIGPSSPKQEMILNQMADTAIVGGAMGSGKSYMALLYPLKFADDPYFRGVIFRKTTGELTAQGGLWETAVELYQTVFGEKNIKIHKKDLKITFPSGGSVKFSHMEHDNNRFAHMGAQYTFILFDEATHFSQVVIEYLGLRIRSARAKHKMQMVLTCNPDPDWFGLEWLKWYLHEDGTPDQSKDGIIRYYVVDNGEYVWADDKKELEAIYGEGDESGIKTFTYISATCYDNPKLLANDRGYISRLKSKPFVDVQRYLYGNWLVRPTGASMVRREWFIEKDEEPVHTDIVKTVRAFDFAFKKKTDAYPNPDYTISVKMSKLKDGNYFIHDIRRTRILPGEWMDFILESAMSDGPNVEIVLPLDPQTRYSNSFLSKDLSAKGFYVRQFQATGKKGERFKPFASMVMNGGMQILRNCGTDYENGISNDLNFFYRELEAYDGMSRSSGDRHDDLCDGCSDAFGACAQSIHIPDFLGSLQMTNLKMDNPFLR